MVLVAVTVAVAVTAAVAVAVAVATTIIRLPEITASLRGVHEVRKDAEALQVTQVHGPAATSRPARMLTNC
jgi:hypothetical protein